MITSTHHSGFVVKDLARAVKFYRDVMGLKIYDSFDLDGEELSRGLGYENAHIRGALLWAGPGHILELLEYINPPLIERPTEDRNALGAGHFAFTVDDCEKTYLMLISKGVRVLNPPAEPLPGVKICYLQDPEGNWIEIVEISDTRTPTNDLGF